MTEADSALHRLREAFTPPPEDTRAGKDCIPAERIWAAVRGELSHHEVRRLGGHAVSCPSCTEAWSLARDLAADAFPEERVAVEQRVGARAPWRGWWGLSAAAAGLAMVAVIVHLWQQPVTISDPQFRAPAAESVRSLLPPDAVLSREDCVLRWAGPAGARYDVRVATADLRLLGTAEGLEATEYRVAPEILADLPAGARLVWQIKTLLPDGRRLPSRSFVFILE